MGYFICHKCKNKVSDMAPRIRIDDIEVCVNCMPEIIINYAKMPGVGGIQPFILQAVLNECFDRKRRIAIPRKTIQKVFSKYKRECTICGSTEKLEIDHIHPYSKGGTNDISNLQVLCKSCNIKKSNKV